MKIHPIFDPTPDDDLLDEDEEEDDEGLVICEI